MRITPFRSTLAVGLLCAWASGTAVAAAETANPAKVMLAALAHPDDETVCAGTLARAAAAGWDVHVLYATSGDAGQDVSGRNLKGAALGRGVSRRAGEAVGGVGEGRRRGCARGNETAGAPRDGRRRRVPGAEARKRRVPPDAVERGDPRKAARVSPGLSVRGVCLGGRRPRRPRQVGGTLIERCGVWAECAWYRTSRGHNRFLWSA